MRPIHRRLSLNSVWLQNQSSIPSSPASPSDPLGGHPHPPPPPPAINVRSILALRDKGAIELMFVPATPAIIRFFDGLRASTSFTHSVVPTVARHAYKDLLPTNTGQSDFLRSHDDRSRTNDITSTSQANLPPLSVNRLCSASRLANCLKLTIIRPCEISGT